MVKKKNKESALRFSIRIAGSVTSLSLRRNLVSLWLTLNTQDETVGDYQGKVSNFIYSCLSKWDKDTAKGFSDFVSEKMIQDILERRDFIKYKRILSSF